MSLQYKKHIKRTQDRPGGIVHIEVNCHVELYWHLLATILSEYTNCRNLSHIAMWL